jgi:hypothetical protein
MEKPSAVAELIDINRRAGGRWYGPEASQTRPDPTQGWAPPLAGEATSRGNSVKIRSSLLSLAALAAGAVLFTGGEARAAAITVPVTGKLGAITISGTATVDTQLVLDEFGGPPAVIVSVHVGSVTAKNPGQSVSLTGSGEAVLIRGLDAADTVNVSVALDKPGTVSGTATKTATAQLALRLDPVTGAALGGTGTFAP